jgi:hypothetical protein
VVVLTASATPCAVDGETVGAFIECIRSTLGLSGLPTIADVHGTSLEELYGLSVTFTQREGCLYYGEIDHVWQFAAQPLPSTAARARIVARQDPAP